MRLVPITFVLFVPIVFFVPLVLLGACAGSTGVGSTMAKVAAVNRPEPSPPTDVEGVAQNCKGCAAIVAVDGRVIHISGLDSWPSSAESRVVRAKGRLVREARLPRARQDADGAWSQGVAPSSAWTQGISANNSSEWWLDDATWSLVDVVESVPWTLRISDGSGNTTTLSWDAGASAASWRYVPVTPETSSSGTYSGGKPAEGTLSAERAQELWRLVHALESTTAAHVADRAMGTTMVMVEDSVGKRSFVVRSGAAVDLETLLAKLRAH